MASGVNHPSCSCAMWSKGMSAERVCGYSPMTSRARCSFSTVNRAITPPPRGSAAMRAGEGETASPVDASHDGVDRGDDRDGVSDKAAAHQGGQGFEVVEGGVAHVH